MEVDDAIAAPIILGRQRPHFRRHRVDEAGVDILAEAIDAGGQENAVQVVLVVGILFAKMHLPGAILGDAGGLQQHPVERGVLSLALAGDLARRDDGGAAPQAAVFLRSAGDRQAGQRDGRGAVRGPQPRGGEQEEKDGGAGDGHGAPDEIRPRPVAGVPESFTTRRLRAHPGR